MAHLIACPECTKELQVPDDLLGTTVQCPECKHTFSAQVAEAANQSPEPAEAKQDTAKKGSKMGRSDDDDDIDIGRPRRSRGSEKPGKVTGIGVMMLIGGIEAILLALGAAGATVGMCCLWPGTYYSLVIGILAIVKASSILGADASRNPPPTGTAIMMIINIINGDILCLVLGIIILVFCGDEEVQGYLAKG